MSSQVFYWAFAAVATVGVLTGIGAPWPLAVLGLAFSILGAVEGAVSGFQARLGARVLELEKDAQKGAQALEKASDLHLRLVRVENRTAR